MWNREYQQQHRSNRRISDLEDKNFEITQSEKKKKNRMKREKKVYVITIKKMIYKYLSARRRQGGGRNLIQRNYD